MKTSSGINSSNGVKTVLFIDHALTFGGSLIVTSHLARYLDPSRYRAVVIGEVDESVLHHLFARSARYYRIPRAYNYQDRARLRELLGGESPGLLTRVVRRALHSVLRLGNLVYMVRVARVVAREKVDIIHHSNGAILPFLRLFRRPLVGTMQGIPSEPLSPLHRRTLEDFGAFIMISEVVRQRYVATGGRAEIAELMPNPCDPEPISDELRATAREQFGLPADARVVGIVGRVVPWKGQREFLAAAERLLERVPDAFALIVGDTVDGADEYMRDLRSRASTSPHANRIRFTGYVQDMRRAYAVLDVAVHASIEPEPFGLVVIEALGYGIPIVAANTGAPPEIVDDGVDGFLVDPHDTDALAGALYSLVTDDELRRQMGERGKRKVFTTYHARPYSERMQAIYDRVLASSPRR